MFLSSLFIGTLLFLDTFHFTSFLFVISNLFKNVYNFCLRIFWSTWKMDLKKPNWIFHSFRQYSISPLKGKSISQGFTVNIYSWVAFGFTRMWWLENISEKSNLRKQVIDIWCVNKKSLADFIIHTRLRTSALEMKRVAYMNRKEQKKIRHLSNINKGKFNGSFKLLHRIPYKNTADHYTPLY